MPTPAKRAELSQHNKVTPTMETLTAMGQVRLRQGVNVRGSHKLGVFSNAIQKGKKIEVE